MGLPVVIAGFPSSNRVPGAFGEVLFGVGGQSAASLPKKLLVVGLKTASGTIAADTQVQPILSTADADSYAGAGSEGACMLYDALALAGNLGVPIYYASPTPAGGATAATAVVKFGGTATAAGAVSVRVAGKTITQSIANGDTAATVATNLAAAISGYGGGRLPASAAASTVYCTISCRTAGQRGMQHVVFLDTTSLPAGITATLAATWTTLQAYVSNDMVIPTAAHLNGFYFKCTTGGTTGGTEPTWPTTIGSTVTDGTVTWTCWGHTATGNAPTTAVFLGNGTGLETYTALLTTLTSQSYDRIALAPNDATSLAAWKTQIDGYAAAPANFLQHVCVASNDTLANATSIAQTTLNDPRFQVLWELNAETHPSRIAAAMAATRAGAEQQNPNASYDGYVLSTVAPQSQQADWPTLATLISAINNSLTPVSSYRGDGFARVERSITTKSLTGGNADYSTIDTGMASTADFVLTDAKLYWSSVLQPNNPVCQDDPPPGQRQPPSGVLTPSRVVAALFSRLVDFSKGVLAGTSPTVPPIVLAPQAGDVTAQFDQVALRIMAAENVRVMPITHQLGVSVRQTA